VTLIIDGLLVAAAVFAGTYCFVLARRVRALKDLDTGIGGAITRMTQALEEARRALEQAKSAGREEHRDLRQLVGRAEVASAQLRVLLAATRDLPEPVAPPSPRKAPASDAPAPPDGVNREGDADAPAARSEAPKRASGRGPEVSEPGAWAPAAAPGARAPGRRGADHPETAPTDDIVPRPARLVRPTDALLRARMPASPVAVPTGEADLLASLADFASSGRT
jgi:hypothetical protein